MQEELKIAELLCTRLCHDLTGPIGAVNNGAEFLAEEGFNLQNQAVELITTSAFSAVSRLQFYRMAYGRVKEHGEAALGESQRLATDFFAGSRVTLDWPESCTEALGVPFSQRMVRLLFNLLVVSSGALLKGGTIAVALGQEEGGAKWIRVTASGDAIKWEPEVEALMTSEIDVLITPKNVQFYLTRQLAAELNTRLTFHADAHELRIHAVREMAEVIEPPLAATAES